MTGIDCLQRSGEACSDDHKHLICGRAISANYTPEEYALAA